MDEEVVPPEEGVLLFVNRAAEVERLLAGADGLALSWDLRHMPEEWLAIVGGVWPE